MGQTAQGWKLRRNDRSGIWYARFRHNQKRHEISTGERDAEKAAKAAAEIYTATVAGGQKRSVKAVATLVPLEELFAAWLTSLTSTHDEGTITCYAQYATGKFIPFFRELRRFDSKSLGEFVRERLRHVTRQSVSKEMSALRNFLSWCVEQEYLGSAPEPPTLNKRAVGERAATPIGQAQLCEEEVQAILRELPELSPGRIGRPETRFPIRARFVVAWETGLRPKTLDEITHPENYQPGDTHLKLFTHQLKARRNKIPVKYIPLTPAAREALDFACAHSQEGLIFGTRDAYERRELFLVPAAIAAGLQAEKVENLHVYDLRRARTTQLLEDTGNLPGVMYILDHTQVTTTQRYINASQRAAEAVMAHGNRSLAHVPSPRLLNPPPRALGGIRGEGKRKESRDKVQKRTTQPKIRGAKGGT